MTALEYEAYFATGVYDRRYPGANDQTLRRILNQIADIEGQTLLDLGAGSGRYAIAILQATIRTTVVAVEPSPAARSLLAKSAEQAAVAHRLRIYGALNELDCEVTAAISIFGVLGHVTNRSERSSLLHELRRVLPMGAPLVVSVPSVWRRFPMRVIAAFLDSPAQFDGVITYSRRLDDKSVTLPYKLFTAKTLREELKAAGFETHEFHAESALPERFALSSSWASRLDAALSRPLPANLGYGILANARAM
jgi:SAM-dependent methyltransferase